MAIELPHICLQNIMTVGGKLAVVLDTLQPPPHSITTVVARVGASIQQVRD